MGHNLGMSHDFMDSDYVNCRKSSDGSTIPCNTCANYQPDNNQKIGVVTGDPMDCCNGFMGYNNHPHYWSECSVRMFEQHYVSENWAQCMDTTTGNQFQLILILVSYKIKITMLGMHASLL